MFWSRKNVLTYVLVGSWLSAFSFHVPQANAGPVTGATETRSKDDLYFDPKNKVSLTLYLNDIETPQKLDAFIRPGTALISMQGLFKFLGGTAQIDQEAGTVTGNLPFSKKPYALSTQSHDVRIDGVDREIPGQLKIVQGEAYLDHTSLEAMLNSEMAIEPVDSRLVLRSSQLSQWSKFTPTPEDEEIVYGLAINGQEMEEFLAIRTREGQFFLPLSELVHFFEFPIAVSAKQANAKGWFIHEDSTFLLDRESAKVNGNTTALESANSTFTDEEIYIRQDLVEKWFGLQFRTDNKRMLLDIIPTRTMPFEAKKLREKQQAALHSKKTKTIAANIQKLETPYEPYRVPVADFNIINSYSSGDAGGYSSNYTLLTRGDLAYMSSDFFISGDLAGDAASEARFRMSQKSESKELLGSLQATQFEMGDIDSNALSLVGSTSQGRGFKISNRSIYRPDQFDLTSFIGNATPGWDAELYRNDVLLDAQAIGSDGAYRFVSVPILFGKNNFRVVLYGPQGQIQEITKEFYAGNTLLNQGEFSYNLSVDDKAGSLLSITDYGNQPQGFRGIGELEYGFSKWLTGAVGTANVPLQDGDHQFVTSGVRVNLGSMLGSFDNAYDVNGGTASRVAVFASPFDIDLRAQYARYNDYISEEEDNPLDPLSQVATLDLNTQVIAPLLGDVSVGAGFISRERQSGLTENLLTNRLSKNVWGVSLTNYLFYDFGDNERMNGNFSARGFLGDYNYLVGASVDYGIIAPAEVSRINLESQFYLSNDMVNRVTLGKDLTREGRSEIGNVLTWDLHDYGVSLYTTASDDSNYFVGLSLNLSMGSSPGSRGWFTQNRPLSDTGSVIARAYRDYNNNNHRDLREPYLQDAEFKVGTSNARKADHGETFIPQLAPFTPTTVSLDTDSLKDPLLVPAVDGVALTPREGYIANVEIPVQEASEIEGNAYYRSQSETVPAKDAVLVLMNEHDKEVAISRVEFDGYYLFSKVLPGKYRIYLSDEDGHPAKNAQTLRHLKITKADYYTDKTVYIPHEWKQP